MIGHQQDMNSPEVHVHRTYPLLEKAYPRSADPLKPSISGRLLMILILLNLSKHYGNALPLIALQRAEYELTLELRPFRELYQLFYVNSNGVKGFHAPERGNPSHHLRNFLHPDIARTAVPAETVNVNARLDANYGFLTTIERNALALKPMDRLYETVSKYERLGLDSNTLVDLPMQNPVKEIIFVLRRSDQQDNNAWTDYTDQGREILLSAQLIMNGLPRTEEKPAAYYSMMQPWHHSGAPSGPRVYCMNFGLFPEQAAQSSGSFNASRVNRIQMLVRTRQPQDSSYHYELVVYSIGYNFLRCSLGTGALVFAS